MRISNNVVGSSFISTYRDATTLFSGGGFANTDNFSFSQILDPSEIYSYFLDEFNDKRHLLDVEVLNLRDKYILINSDGFPIRNISINQMTAHKRMGIIKIMPDGRHYQVMWGFGLGAVPSKYLSLHLSAHNTLIGRDKTHRVIANVSSPYYQQFTYLLENENETIFTHKMWDSLTDLARLTPNGIGLIPSINIPSKHANELYAKKFEKYNVVARDKQNYLVAGPGWENVISVAQSVERAAYNAVTIGQQSNDKPYFTQEYFHELESIFKVKLNPAVVALSPTAAELDPQRAEVDEK